MIKRKKLKMAALHINSCKEDSITTGVRLTRYMSKFLNIPFIHNKTTAIAYQDTYDILFVKFGILLFCDYRPELFEIYKNAKRIISLEEDYTMGADYRLTKLNPSLEIWTNMPWRLKQFPGHYINWNRMTWKHGLTKNNSYTLKGLGYFGAYRPDREIYFKKYFKDTSYPVHISTYPRNALKFRDLDTKIRVLLPFKNREQIQAFQSILYIEDTFTHSHYNSPANRFYECLCNGVPILFDKACLTTFKLAGYNINHYIVGSQKDVIQALNKTHNIAISQRQLWYRNYYEELGNDVNKLIIKTIGGRYGIQGNYPNI